MMVHLLRLRQACLHPTLSVFPQPIVQTAKSMQMKIASSLGERVVDRLLSIKNELAFTEVSTNTKKKRKRKGWGLTFFLILYSALFVWILLINLELYQHVAIFYVLSA